MTPTILDLIIRLALILAPQITGPAPFVHNTEQALIRLQGTPYAEFVNRHINSIIMVDRRTGVDPTLGIMWATEEYATDSPWYACALVHEAQHVEQQLTNQANLGGISEYNANKVQLACLHSIDAPQGDIEWLEQIQANIVNGTTHYWDTDHDY